MQNKQGSGTHRQKDGHLQGQQNRGQMSRDDRSLESGRTGGEPQQQDTHGGKSSHMEREKGQKGKGSPA